MYIFKNAVKSITRNKLRNILIGIIVLIIAVSACVSLSIQQAAEVAKEDTLSNLSVTAQISFDRQKAMEEMRNNADEGSDGMPDRSKFDFDILQGSSLTLDNYMTYTKALGDGDSYYYSGAFSLDATGDLLPYGTEEEDDSATTIDDDFMGGRNSDEGGQPNGEQFGGRGGRRFQVNEGDFTVTGYSSYDAMLSMFGEDGSYSITDGAMFDEDSDALECIISNELAAYNGLSVGDTLKLSNPSCEDETYKLKIVGIYTNSESSSEENNRFRMNDPANNIYMNYTAFSKILTKSEKAANTTTDSNGDETSAVLTNNLAFTYTFASVENYESFADKVYDLGLSDDYTVSSNDLQAYENSLLPLEALSQTAMWFFFIVLGVGGIILVTLNIFNLRERKYEVGVLTAIGMKKAKVAMQFVTEIFIVTFIALIIGTSVGAAVSVPATNTLLANQIQSSQTSGDRIGENFGFKPDGNDMKGDMKGGPMGDRFMQSRAQNYVDTVSSATNLIVVLELICVGLFLTIAASLAALISIMRYEPLKILSNRS
ncbi:MAG: ABC transporter permease [Ruminococcus sp.]|nr:ABC transporter permease [Ruminococcus sp.]